jgi:hypothetical protein
MLITDQPESRSVCNGGSAEFEVHALGSAAPFTFTWRRNGVVMNSDQGGVTILPSADGRSSKLILSECGPGDEAAFDCLVSDGYCRITMSATAWLTICTGDFNCDGGIDGTDVETFFSSWESGDSRADVNGDGGVDGADVNVFFEHWESGC